MDNNILKSFKELEKVQNSIKRMNEYAYNQKIGYEPKCKICNSKYQDVIESSREKGHTLKDMKKYLESKGEDVSLMSLSRHFDRHYPARKEYLRGLDEEKLRLIEKGEKEIENTLKYYPGFKDELERNHTLYFYEDGELKSLTKTGRDIFIFHHGYCTTGTQFCELVPKNQYIGGWEVTDEIKVNLNSLLRGLESDYLDRKKLKLIDGFLKCTQCQVFYNDCCTEALMKLVLNNKYGVDMNKDEFTNLAFQEDFIPKDIDKKLQKMTPKNVQGIKKTLRK